MLLTSRFWTTCSAHAVGGAGWVQMVDGRPQCHKMPQKTVKKQCDTGGHTLHTLTSLMVMFATQERTMDSAMLAIDMFALRQPGGRRWEWASVGCN